MFTAPPVTVANGSLKSVLCKLRARKQFRQHDPLEIDHPRCKPRVLASSFFLQPEACNPYAPPGGGREGAHGNQHGVKTATRFLSSTLS